MVNLQSALASLLLGIAVPAFASSQTPQDAFNASVEDLVARFGPASERRLPPANNIPEVAADIAAISNARDAFGSERFPVVFPDTFQSVCAPLQDLTMRYLRAGLPSDDYLIAGAARTAQNSHQYQAALVPIASFNFKCLALHFPEFQKFWHDLPDSERSEVRKNGVRKVRSGAGEMIEGLAITSIEIGITPANHKLLADELAAYADELVAMTPPAQRVKILQRIDSNVPTFKSRWPTQYAALRKSLLDTSCSDACLVE